MRDVVVINNESHNLGPIIHALRNGALGRSGDSAASRSIELEDRAVRVPNEAVVNRVRVAPVARAKAKGRDAGRKVAFSRARCAAGTRHVEDGDGAVDAADKAVKYAIGVKESAYNQSLRVDAAWYGVY